MSALDYKFDYQRKLPHLQPEGATFFVTFRLFGTIPKSVLAEWQVQYRNELATAQTVGEDSSKDLVYITQRRQFGRWDAFLDLAEEGPTWLEQPEIAKIVSDAIHFLANKGRYKLDAFCVMPNHVHIVLRPNKAKSGRYESLPKIMHGIKSFTASKSNELLGRKGSFWQSESYDHAIRDEEERQRIINYVLHNPVKAGLVDDWRKWRWSFAAHEESTGTDADTTSRQGDEIT